LYFGLSKNIVICMGVLGIDLLSILKVVGVAGAMSLVFTVGYTGYLSLTRQQEKITTSQLLSFGLATPAVWIGMSVNFAMLGLYLGFFPNSSIIVLYSGLTCLLPSTFLVHSVIEDSNRPCDR